MRFVFNEKSGISRATQQCLHEIKHKAMHALDIARQNNHEKVVDLLETLLRQIEEV